MKIAAVRVRARGRAAGKTEWEISAFFIEVAPPRTIEDTGELFVNTYAQILCWSTRFSRWRLRPRGKDRGEHG